MSPLQHPRVQAVLARAQALARRVDALTLRERVILFASTAVVAVAAFDHLLLSPRLAEQKAQATQIRQLAREADGLRAQLAPDRVGGPAGALMRELDTLRAQQASLDQALEQLHLGHGGTQLPDLLERVLRRHERLTLLRLTTAKPGPGVAGEAAQRGQAGAARQAVQLALRGSYPDLTQYLADTEAALPGLHWGEVTVTRQGASAELSATVLLHRSPT